MKKKKRKWGMFEGASHIIFENAKELRNNMTAAEIRLWLYLRKGINGFKFRRQHPIGAFVADFFCFKIKLIIELDGNIHNLPDVKEIDEARQKDLEELGYSVLRFSNDEVLNNIDSVINAITEKLKSTPSSQEPPNPNPQTP